MKSIFLALCVLISLSASQIAVAASTGWLTNDNHPPVKTRLMLTGELDLVSKTLPAVLEVKLDGDWKTYWRSPGEGGIAPSIKWDDSTNLNHVEWSWPTPDKFSLLGMQTFGYQGEVVFPLLLTLDDMSANTQLHGKFTLSSCTTICVLTDYEINLDFNPSDLRADSDAMFAYNKAASKVPQKVTAEDSASAIKLGWDSAKSQLEVILDAKQWQRPEIIIDGEPDTLFKLVGTNKVEKKDGTQQLVAIFDGESWLGEPELLDKSLNITVVDNNHAIEYLSPVNATQIIESGSSLLTILLFALLGGLILNVMPCVLPVLGMKLSSVVAAPDLQKNQIRQQFLASALGILVSFWLLAGFILVLKLTGQAIGWGVQFQNPWFIGFMALVTSVFALNMLGAFEINLPSSFQTKLATTGGNNNRGHFLQGMFATLLATPCSAPFLGTAVAFALGADTLSLLVIFTALAVGMALPWLVVAAFPQVASYFPKPGRWMSVIKVVFSVLLLITSLWLISLLSSFIAVSYLFGAAAVLLITFFIFMAKTVGVAAVVATFSITLMLAAVSAFMTSEQWAKALPTDLQWTPLSETLIAEQVTQGKTVFVDVTADWCITCKANKVGVILQDPVYSALKQDNMLLMIGDWTTPSEHITNYLQSHNRFGVPFNVVYGPNAPHGIELPVILSTKDVLAAIERASAR
ncbi:thioredoxin family protein [Shewanella sp. D64]|uniref:protein-disulfide reductase DsbD family protein n=1 Tax=unclassified Shewanella TaxID=196818 RepID=UPI0022BA5B09|nr:MULTISPECIES: protein-disulfide reductase DsbD domain-containing protein [unclassified Shewanella]MEC4725150.1 thioredoxin family protein [Shewanella sp. D64]MEC4737051.1 thioredoxin family protein [Shewanella sp. E94]WBJ98102.1 thioredoxin family protein [Shewanella sp. MTB7]